MHSIQPFITNHNNSLKHLVCDDSGVINVTTVSLPETVLPTLVVGEVVEAWNHQNSQCPFPPPPPPPQHPPHPPPHMSSSSSINSTSSSIPHPPISVAHPAVAVVPTTTTNHVSFTPTATLLPSTAMTESYHHTNTDTFHDDPPYHHDPQPHPPLYHSDHATNHSSRPMHGTTTTGSSGATKMTASPLTSSFSSSTPPPTTTAPEYVYSMIDQSILCDQYHRPITVGRMLATKPLVTDLLTRPGPGNKKLVYLSGDTITRSLNEIFTYTGWNLQIVHTEQVLCVDTKAAATTTAAAATTTTNSSAIQKPHHSTVTTTTNPSVSRSHQPMWHVAYLSQVRITLTQSGTYREDLGAGDAMDKNLGTAIQHAIKASITDAMKRAARHFGDKLGNSLYQGTFRMANAPKTLSDALQQYDQHHETKYKNIHTTTNCNPAVGSSRSATTTAPAATIAAPPIPTAIPLHNTSYHHYTSGLPPPPSVANHQQHPLTTTTTKNLMTTSPPLPPQYHSSSVASCTNGGPPRNGHTVVRVVPTIATATMKPPLTASENLQQLQSKNTFFGKANGTTNHQNRYHHSEGTVMTTDQPSIYPSKTVSTGGVTAAVTTTNAIAVRTNHPLPTTPVPAATILRPRTSSGRIRKSLSPTTPAIGMHHPNEGVVVMAKKAKLNPYST